VPLFTSACCCASFSFPDSALELILIWCFALFVCTMLICLWFHFIRCVLLFAFLVFLYMVVLFSLGVYISFHIKCFAFSSRLRLVSRSTWLLCMTTMSCQTLRFLKSVFSSSIFMAILFFQTMQLCQIDAMSIHISLSIHFNFCCSIILVNFHLFWPHLFLRCCQVESRSLYNSHHYILKTVAFQDR
jgi:hypothetical protein